MLSARLIIASIIALSLATTAHASQSSNKLSEKTTTSATIDGPARAEVESFIILAIKNLKSNQTDPFAVRTGREMVVTAMTKQQVSNSFRTVFTAMILPELLKVITEENPFAATNALEVVKVLQCPDSLLLLAEQSSPAKQTNPSLRLVAAGGLATLRTPIELQTSQADGILKIVGANAAKESDWMIAAYDLQTLQSFSTSPQVPKASQATARGLLLSNLASIVTRIRKGTASPSMIRAVGRSLTIYLRDQVPVANPADVATFMTSLEPTLKEIKLLAAKPPAGDDAAAFAQTAKIADTIMVTFLGGKPAPKPPALPPAKPATKSPSSTK